jgi:hypothetical protein
VLTAAHRSCIITEVLLKMTSSIGILHHPISTLMIATTMVAKYLATVLQPEAAGSCWSDALIC